MTITSPDVAALGKFGFLPVSKYTGSASIGVPIYTVPFDGKAIPIGLSYHTGGIRAMEEASWVGLGFALSANAVITRAIKDLDDINPSMGFPFMPALPDPSHISSNATNLHNYFLQNSASSYNGGQVDGEPDIFVANLFGASFKFILEKSLTASPSILYGQGLDQNGRHLNIEYHLTNQKFIIKDNSGYQYIFEDHETTTNIGGGSNGTNGYDPNAETLACSCGSMSSPSVTNIDMITGWHITQVISPKGKTLDFSYTNPVVIESQRLANQETEAFACGSFSGTGSQSIINVIMGRGNNDFFNTSNMPTFMGPRYSCSYSITKAIYLDKITYEDLEVAFTTSDRLDIKVGDNCGFVTAMNGGQAQKLDQIAVTRNGHSLMNASFQYDYFNNSHVSENDATIRTNQLRLKLDEILIQDAKHTFEYISPNSLPAKNTKAVDHWGFYNGKNNDRRYVGAHMSSPCSYIPGGLGNPQSVANQLCVDGANREADPAFGEIGSLNKVNYPTGGYDELHYEGHEIKVGLSSFITTMNLLSNEATNTKPPAIAQGKTNNTQVVDEKMIRILSEWKIGCQENGDGSGIFIEVRCDPFVYTNGGPSGCTLPTGVNNVDISYQIIKVNPVTNVEDIVVQGLYSNNSAPPGHYVSADKTMQVEAILEPGLYKLKAFGTTNYSTKITAVIPKSLDWDETTNDGGSNRNYIAGGLRIGKVSTYESDGQLALEKQYRYKEETSSMSSGQLMSPVLYYKTRAIDWDGNSSTGAYHIVLGSNNVIGVQASAQGSHVGYSRVEEIQTGFDDADDDEWKIVSEYQNSPGVGSFQADNYFGMYLSIHGAYPPNTLYDITNGQLLEETYWKGTTPTLVQKVENTYQEQLWQSIFAVQPTYTEVGTGTGNYTGSVKVLQSLAPYTHHVSSSWLTETRTTTYDDNGNALVSSQRVDYNNYDLPVKTEVTNSDGTKHITRTKYAQDFDYADLSYGFSNPKIFGIKSLVDQNMFVPVEVQQLIDKGNGEQLLNAGFTVFYNLNGIPLPVEQHVTERNSITDNYTPATISGTNIDLSSYHKKTETTFNINTHNVESYRRVNDIPTSLIWNTTDKVPLVKVVNAEPDEIFYTSFEEGSGGHPRGKTGRKSNVGAYTIDVSQLSLDPNKSYILSFWESFDGLNWVYVEQQITPNGNNIQVSPYSATYIDEVRLYPKGALMTTVTYDPNTFQITSINNENNLTAHFEYDNFHRLEHVKDFDGNLIAKHEYNYADATKSGNDVYNYVKSWTFLTNGVNSGNYQNYNISDGEVTEAIQFMDGLGRPIQSIAVGQATDGGDIVSHTEYDEFGRSPKQFLPFVQANNGGAFVNNAANIQNSYNIMKYGSGQPSFAETAFDGSPLNRVVEQGAPGADWQLGSGHTTRSNFRANTSSEVYDFENDQYYPANQLIVAIVTDENGVPSFTYTDKIGRTILSKRIMNTGTGGSKNTVDIATYYIYDDFGRVEKVLPPEATRLLPSLGWNENHPSLSEWIYTYTYDERSRLIEKKIPGSAVQEMVYDELDRLVLTQDGNLRHQLDALGNPKNDWLFTKYDQLSRPIMTGIFENPNNTDRAGLATNLQAATTLYETRTNGGTQGYTYQAYPNTGYQVHSVTYYDDYDFDNNGSANFALNTMHTSEVAFDRLQGKLTGTKVKILDGTNTWIHTVTFYDERDRVLQIQAQNHKGGWDITTNAYDFAGKVLETVRDHTVTGNNLVVLSRFEYDHSGRLELMKYGVSEDYATASEELIILAANEYDQIGQMIEKKLHSTNGSRYLQNIDYRYNIRGWLTDINDVNFGGLSAVELSEEISNGLVERIKDSDIEIEVNVTDLNNQIYDEVKVKEERTEERGAVTEQKSEEKHLELEDASIQSSLNSLLAIDYSGKTLDENNYEQEFEQLRNDLEAEMTTLGITDQKARDLVEEEVMNHFRDNWNNVNANDNDNDLFGMHLDYTTANAQTGAIAQYNGNISQIKYRVRGDADISTYGFQYDDLNRLTNAKYAQYDGSNYTNMDHYTVSNITYDWNGNILSLNRNGFTGSGFGAIDQLTYTYNANQLQSVHDASNDTKGFKEVSQSGTEYTYDYNGNMTRDDNKGISIEYNYLNLPVKVMFTSTKYIEWTYDALGLKLTKTIIDGSNNSSKDYIGGIEYINNALEAIYHEEGRLTTKLGGGYNFEYTIKDHLGNSRVSFADLNGDGQISTDIGNNEILQTNHYYPFGMLHEPIGSVTNVMNKYKFNGTENIDEFGLDWNHTFFRTYDNALGRWHQIDPKNSERESGYVGLGNNPIKYSDFLGDTLVIDPTDTDALDNIKNLVPNKKKYRDRINIDNETGVIDFNLDGIKDLRKFLKNGGSGLELLFSLIFAEEKMFYSTTMEEFNENEALGKDGTQGPDIYSFPDHTFPRRKGFLYKGEYKGLAITPKSHIRYYDQETGAFYYDKSSVSITFHALSEMYYLVNGYIYKEAHKKSNQDAGRFYKKIGTGSTSGFKIFDKNGKIYTDVRGMGNYKFKVVIEHGKTLKPPRIEIRKPSE